MKPPPSVAAEAAAAGVVSAGTGDAVAAGSVAVAAASVTGTVSTTASVAGSVAAGTEASAGAADPKAGAVGSLYDICTDPRLNHQLEVVTELAEITELTIETTMTSFASLFPAPPKYSEEDGTTDHAFASLTRTAWRWYTYDGGYVRVAGGVTADGGVIIGDARRRPGTLAARRLLAG